MELSIYYLVGPLFLESAENCTELSKKCGLSHSELVPLSQGIWLRLM